MMKGRVVFGQNKRVIGKDGTDGFIKTSAGGRRFWPPFSIFLVSSSLNRSYSVIPEHILYPIMSLCTCQHIGFCSSSGVILSSLHCIYSIHAYVSYLYLYHVFFYLHTRLELCILFFNVTKLFLSASNVWCVCLDQKFRPWAHIAFELGAKTCANSPEFRISHQGEGISVFCFFFFKKKQQIMKPSAKCSCCSSP